jgi:hypothetical protein
MTGSRTKREVIVVRDSDESPGILDVGQRPWSVIVFEIIQWRVMIYLPSHRESVSSIFVFESRETARAWSQRDERARPHDWDFLEGPEAGEEADPASSEKRTPQSLTLYDFAGGLEPHYDVPAQGVSDWPGRQPPNAYVPTWTPAYFKSSGQSHMTGHEPYESPGCRCIAAKGPQQDNLSFSILQSAYTY